MASCGFILPKMWVSAEGMLKILSLFVTLFQDAASTSAAAGIGGEEFIGEGYDDCLILGIGRLPVMLTLIPVAL